MTSIYTDYEEGMCGKVEKSIYGTRDAAQNWEEEYSSFMMSIGFRRGMSSPCVFYHKSQNIRVVVHGDDFTVLGHEDQLDWFKDAMSDRYEIKLKARLGPNVKDDKSVRILNRVVWWDSDGIHYEPDQRHTNLLIDSMGLSHA